MLTSARVTSVLLEDGTAVGVSILPHTSKHKNNTTSSAGSSGGGSSTAVNVRIGKGGSVISSTGIIDTFHHLVPLSSPLPSPVRAAAGGGGVQDGKVVGGGGGTGVVEPAGYRDLRAARPRVHLCVGLQGNWMEDLEGTGAYFHHVSS